MPSVEIAKTELRAYTKIQRAIKRKDDDLAEWKARIASARSAHPSGIVVQAPASDSMGDAIIAVLDYEQGVFGRERADLFTQRSVIIGTIESLEYPYDDILLERYTKGHRRLSQCVEELGYEYNYLCALHGKALVAYARSREFPRNFDE
jgi:hypothetical protein